MRVIDVKQGSPEWWEARKGIPTASNFDRILTPKTQKLSSSLDDYLCELIADSRRITPWTEPEEYRSKAMQHGLATEAEARRWYEMERDCQVFEVGFCVEGDGCQAIGCSPDGLIGDNNGGGNCGGLELKCPQGKTHVKYLLAGTLPDEYRCQVHGCLLVTGRPWWDFCSYHPGLPPLLVRVTPDEFTKTLHVALSTFALRYALALGKLDAVEHPPDLAEQLRQSIAIEKAGAFG